MTTNGFTVPFLATLRVEPGLWTNNGFVAVHIEKSTPPTIGTVGNNVMMGPNCVIYTVNHCHDRTDIPMILQGNEIERLVIIGSDVWIGANVIILPGVKIGHGVIIAAGSVVVRDIPEGVLAAGVPCKVIRKITDEDRMFEKHGIKPPCKN